MRSHTCEQAGSNYFTQLLSDVLDNVHFTAFHYSYNPHIGDEMSEKGWQIDRQQFPNSLHLTISRPHQEVVETFINDLQEAVTKAKKLSWTNLSSKLTVKMVQGFSKVLPKKHSVSS